jgi:hypothetical protein
MHTATVRWNRSKRTTLQTLKSGNELWDVIATGSHRAMKSKVFVRTD